MSRIRRRSAAVVLVLPLVLSGCGGTIKDKYVIEYEPATVETVSGDLAKVSLTQQAADRLGVRTARVERVGKELAVPAAAVFVDTEGQWWVFTRTQDLTFLRHEIERVGEDGDRVRLRAGPPVGTEVVITGVAQLRGVEEGIGH